MDAERQQQIEERRMLAKGRGEREEAQPAMRQIPGDVEIVAFLWVPARRGAQPVEMKKDAERQQRDDHRQQRQPPRTRLRLYRLHRLRNFHHLRTLHSAAHRAPAALCTAATTTRHSSARGSTISK